MPWKIKIHEVPALGSDPERPLIVRYKLSEKNDFNTTGNFINREIQIPQKDIEGLDEQQTRELIQTRIREASQVKVVAKVARIQEAQKFENEEFDLVPV